MSILVFATNQRHSEVHGDLQRENFKKAYKAGVKMVFGTDAGIYPHGDNAKQFSTMTRYGMSNLDALRSATSEAADALGMAGQVGTLNKGAFADLIAVKSDPLKDIKALEKVSSVMKGGEVIKDER